MAKLESVKEKGGEGGQLEQQVEGNGENSSDLEKEMAYFPYLFNPGEISVALDMFVKLFSPSERVIFYSTEEDEGQTAGQLSYQKVQTFFSANKEEVLKRLQIYAGELFSRCGERFYELFKAKDCAGLKEFCIKFERFAWKNRLFKELSENVEVDPLLQFENIQRQLEQLNCLISARDGYLKHSEELRKLFQPLGDKDIEGWCKLFGQGIQAMRESKNNIQRELEVLVNQENALFEMYFGLFGLHMREACRKKNFSLTTALWTNFCQFKIYFDNFNENCLKSRQEEAKV